MSTHQTAKTQYVVTPKGTKFAFRRLGTNPGTPLLLLVHFRGTMDKWDPLLVNTLAAYRPVILFDYAGVGFSTGEVATSIRQSANDVIQFLQLIHEEEVDILGFSIGGFVAQLIALNPDLKTLRVRKLILAGTEPSAGPDTLATPHKDVLVWAGAKDLTLETFQVLFFPRNTKGKAAAEAWWARLHERTPSTSGEEVSKWLSDGFDDEGKGLQAQGAQLAAFANPETSQGLEGSYGRLEELKLPVLVANGKVSYF